jgi:hypothetical protein
MLEGKSAKESLNSWKIPSYESDGPMCFFMVGKYHATFGFLRGTSLPDAAGLLEGTREECAPHEVAHRGGSEGTRTEKIDRGAAVEQEGTDGEGDEVQGVDRA